jgi:hypothetical protein
MAVGKEAHTIQTIDIISQHYCGVKYAVARSSIFWDVMQHTLVVINAS